MRIHDTFIGTDFLLNHSGKGSSIVVDESAMLTNNTDALARSMDQQGYSEQQKIAMLSLGNRLDIRTHYLCNVFTGDLQNPLNNPQWYKNYLELNSFIVTQGAQFCSQGHRKSPAYNLLAMGYIPIGFAPSFAPSMTYAVTKKLEEKNIPYIRYFTTSFVDQYYKTNLYDIWISKIDGAKVLGCAPEAVRSVTLFEEVIR